MASSEANTYIGNKREKKIKYNPAETKFLEDAEGKEALEWASKRTQFAKEFFAKSKLYQPIHTTLKDILYDSKKTLTGVIRKGYVYDYWTDEHNPQGVWRRTLLENYSKECPDWEVLIDFDVLSKKIGRKMVARGFSQCPSNPNLFLVHLSFGGKDESFFQEWDMEKKQFLNEGFVAKNSRGEWLEGKFTEGTWVDQDSIILNPDFKKGELTDSLYPSCLYLWKRGDAIEQAKLIYKVPKYYLRVSATRLLNYEMAPPLIYIEGAKDFYNTDKFVWSEKEGSQIIYLPSDAHFQGSFKEYVFFSLRSDWALGKVIPKGSVVVMHWSDLLKEDKKTLKVIFTPNKREVFDFLAMTKDTVFLSTFENVSSKVYTLTFEEGNWSKPVGVSLPYKKACFGMFSDEKEEKALMKIETKIISPSIFLWDKDQGLKLIRKPLYPFNSEDYMFEQYEAKSKDGVRVPYFIVYRKGMKFDGNNPTLLTAYGGFQIINFPYFSRVENEVWVKNGGVSVLANIRGGGEFGPDWHTAAVKEKRQTSFNDFIAVAEDLVQRKITSSSKLGILGGSNGGLLVSVVMTQRPDLFKAVASEVPILDMVRYTEFGAGPSWVAEYGDPKDPKILKAIKKYAPLEHIGSDVTYPSVLITGSVLDQRVHPWHGRILKYVLEKHPTVKSYFIESIDGGHGCGADLNDALDYLSNLYSFFAIHLQLKIKH